MDKLVIRGGEPLLGTVRVSGAKNAALPCMAAALLTDEPVILENIPQVRDIQTTRNLLAAMGAEVELGYGRAQHRTTIHCANLSAPEANYELVKTMRSSTLVLGPLVARCGRAHVSLPGGCAIGSRPIDLHIKGLEKLGQGIKSRKEVFLGLLSGQNKKGAPASQRIGSGNSIPIRGCSFFICSAVDDGRNFRCRMLWRSGPALHPRHSASRAGPSG